MSNAVIDAIVPATIRAYFTRDFKYLPSYDNDKTYFLGDQATYVVGTATNLYQMALSSAVGIPPVPATTPATWTAVALDQTQYVLDSDLSKAISQATANVAPELFESDSILQDAFMYATAHFLVMDIRMAEKGLDSRTEGITTAKSVGSVSTSYGIPEQFLREPPYSYFAQTEYGLKYLTYLIPRVTGATGIAVGWTLP